MHIDVMTMKILTIPSLRLNFLRSWLEGFQIENEGPLDGRNMILSAGKFFFKTLFILAYFHSMGLQFNGTWSGSN